jgi:hypothetical protein
MDEVDFTLNGEPRHLTRDMVIRAMRNQTPGRIQTYSVDIDGVNFPVKQVLAQALQVKSTEFVSTRAQDILTKLEFKVVNLEDPAEELDAEAIAGRALALELAVALHARHNPDVDRVLTAAKQFELWLDS